MSELSTEFKRYETELSFLVNENSETKNQNDLKAILIRPNSLQRIVFEEIKNSKAQDHCPR